MSFPDATYDDTSTPAGGTKRTASVVELFLARRTEPAGVATNTAGVSVATRKSWSSANTFLKSIDTDVPGAMEKGPAGRGGLQRRRRSGGGRGQPLRRLPASSQRPSGRAPARREQRDDEGAADFVGHVQLRGCVADRDALVRDLDGELRAVPRVGGATAAAAARSSSSPPCSSWGRRGSRGTRGGGPSP